MREEEFRNIKFGKINKFECTTDLELIVNDKMLNISFVKSHGLQGVYFVDMINIKCQITISFMDPYGLAYLHVGLADILHVLLSKHFGCYFLVSFDKDIERVKEIIEGFTGLKVLNSPNEILSIL